MPLKLGVLDRPMYGLEYDAEYNYDHHDFGCDGKEMCSCRSIENATITSVDINSIADQVYRGADGVLKYALNRVLRFGPLSDPANWEAFVEPGYYGDEYVGAILNPAIKDQIVTSLTLLENMAPREMMEEALRAEYGYILPQLQNCSWEVLSVPRNQIVIHNPERLAVAAQQNEILEQYTYWKGVSAVCVRDGDTWRLLDGYHRIQLLAPNRRKVLIMAATPLEVGDHAL